MITVDNRAIGPDHPPYIIAELSGNHNGDIQRAFRIMEAAKAAGADAVKLQTYTADTITIDHDGPEFRIDDGLWAGQTLHELYRDAHTPWQWHPELFAKGRELGITVFSSPFDATAIDFLETLDTPAYKVASFEVVDLPLIQRMAATGKPLFMSTGMANLDEIGEAVAAARAAGCTDLVIFHCTSGYPTPPDESNLRTIRDIEQRFACVPGLSDHTHGIAASVAAVALGACVIEKHVTLRRADGGPDAAFSLEPAELTDLVQSCHTAWRALGTPTYQRTKSEAASIKFRRSLYVVADMQAGDVFDETNVRSIRPGFGLPPKHLPNVLGRRAAAAIKRGTALHTDMIA